MNKVNMAGETVEKVINVFKERVP